MDYKEKYLKYKNKYLETQKGGSNEMLNIDPKTIYENTCNDYLTYLVSQIMEIVIDSIKSGSLEKTVYELRQASSEEDNFLKKIENGKVSVEYFLTIDDFYEYCNKILDDKDSDNLKKMNASIGIFYYINALKKNFIETYKNIYNLKRIATEICISIIEKSNL
jgi:hypothetical protein